MERIKGGETSEVREGPRFRNFFLKKKFRSLSYGGYREVCVTRERVEILWEGPGDD